VPFYPIDVEQEAALGGFILSRKPDANIAAQYVNDDLGKDFLRGLKKELGGKVSAIVKEISHEITEPTIDNQVADCKGSGADVFVQLMKKCMPSVSIDDNTATPGYNNAYMIEQVLKRCGNEPTRQNLLKHATSLSNEQPPLFLDGIKVSNSGTDYRAVHDLQITRFDGATWVPIGDLIDLDGIASRIQRTTVLSGP